MSALGFSEWYTKSSFSLVSSSAIWQRNTVRRSLAVINPHAVHSQSKCTLCARRHLLPIEANLIDMKHLSLGIATFLDCPLESVGNVVGCNCVCTSGLSKYRNVVNISKLLEPFESASACLKLLRINRRTLTFL